MPTNPSKDHIPNPSQQDAALQQTNNKQIQSAMSNNPDHNNIYAQQAADYDRMIHYEDDELEWKYSVQQVLATKPYDRIVELGAGTGRFTRVVLTEMSNKEWPNGSYIALDASTAMLEQLKSNIECDAFLGKITAPTAAKLHIQEAVHHKLPLANHSVDLIVAGWTVCYGVCELNDREQQVEAIARIMNELTRVLCPGGRIAIWETLGTGVAAPAVPASLQVYIQALEEQYGFHRTELSTSFRFPSMEEAKYITNWFFGSTACDLLTPDIDGSVVLPSYTGLWVWDNNIARH
ncbi:class I SAM-dependent methyltransferase [Paenibacillus sp. S-12]|uniref:class I SAM-dependent methyltransferase n=1 Tax=unclassified Paenibacillus TaxID=185978 RepID=UPI0025A3040F|nr:class I SAM-dependent methyltransferase [Paenibacillus sp. S-12]